MKIVVCLALLIAVASAGKTHYSTGIVAGPAPLGLRIPIATPVGPVSTGTSSQFRQEDNLGNYNFGYDESHATGASSRREEQVNGVVRGSYALNDADGRRRIVHYIADDNGFRANIETNEPGVEAKDPADILINKPQVIGKLTRLGEATI